MNRDLTCLRDPDGGGMLVAGPDSLVASSGRQYPIVRGIPRFVDPENYSADFGAQWNRFPRTQLDSHSGRDLSETRLNRCLHGNLPGLRGQLVLEAGSGAGRFTEVLLKHGAVVHSFDYSNAVEANASNNGEHDDLVLVQADIRHLPFARASYDCVVCLGVLQHTPSPEESVRSLWSAVKPGGVMAFDHYLWQWRDVLPPPFGGAEIVYRQIALRLPARSRFAFVKALTDFWFPWHWRFRESLTAQRILRRVSPVHFYYPRFALRDRDAYYEWALLDAHDGTTDVYKHRRKPAQIVTLLESLGAAEIAVTVGGNGIEAYCRKPM